MAACAYPLVQYIPGEDVDFSQLQRTDHVTYCPYKGDCNYYSVAAGGKQSVNALWAYEDPFPAVMQIRGHVAFYPERVDEIAELQDCSLRAGEHIGFEREQP